MTELGHMQNGNLGICDSQSSWHVVFRGPKLKSVTWEQEKAEEQGTASC